MEKHYKNIAKVFIFSLLLIIHTGFLNFVGMGLILSLITASILSYLVIWNLTTFDLKSFKHAIIFFAFYAALEGAIGGIFFYIEVITDSGARALRVDIREFISNYTGIIYSVYFAIIFFTSAINFFIKTHSNITYVEDNLNRSFEGVLNELKSKQTEQTNSVNSYNSIPLKDVKQKQLDRIANMNANEKKKVEYCLRLKKDGISYDEIAGKVNETKNWVYYRISEL